MPQTGGGAPPVPVPAALIPRWASPDRRTPTKALTRHLSRIYRDAARYHASHRDRTDQCSRTTPTTTMIRGAIAGTRDAPPTARRSASATPRWRPRRRRHMAPPGRDPTTHPNRPGDEAHARLRGHHRARAQSRRPLAAERGLDLHPPFSSFGDEGLVTGEEIDSDGALGPRPPTRARRPRPPGRAPPGAHAGRGRGNDVRAARPPRSPKWRNAGEAGRHPPRLPSRSR